MRKIFESDKGSITLEYIVVLGLAIPVWVMWLGFFNAQTGYTDAGMRLVAFFQRILAGISLPIP